MSQRFSPRFTTGYKVWLAVMLAACFFGFRSSFGSALVAVALTTFVAALGGLPFGMLMSTSVTVGEEGAVWVDQFGRLAALGPIDEVTIVESGSLFPGVPTLRGSNGSVRHAVALTTMGRMFDKSVFESFQELHSAASLHDGDT